MEKFRDKIGKIFDNMYLPDIGDTLKVGNKKGFNIIILVRGRFPSDGFLTDSNKKVTKFDLEYMTMTSRLTRIVLLEKNLFGGKDFVLAEEIGYV